MTRSLMMLLCMLTVGVLSRWCLAADVALVEDGRSAYVIAVSEKASESEKFAAEELQSHIEKISGAKLPVVSQPPAPGAKAVLLGADLYPGRDAPDWKAMGDDGFLLSVQADGPIVIAGGRKRGTLYGVYTLLERIGVRWWTPTESFLPSLKTIRLPATAETQVPKLEYRDMMYGEIYGAEGQLWAVRNKVNGFAWSRAPEKYGGRYEFVGNLVHSYMTLLGRSGMETKPEMLALVNGKRTNDQPCLTNPDTVKAMTAGVLRAFRENPGAKFVVVGQMDNRNYCRCDTCKALADKEESPAGPVIQFANQVAEAVEKEIPGACITTAAYEWSRKPPKSLKPRDNVFITLCSIECDFAHPLATATTKTNAEFRRDIEGWAKIAKRIYIWDYTTDYSHYFLPWPNLDVLVPNTKFFTDHKMHGVFEQGSHTTRAACFAPIKMWVLAKAQWNPDADGNALLKEFVEGYYGPAAPAMKKYIDILHAPFRAAPEESLGINAPLSSKYLSPTLLADAEAALRQAEQAAAGKPDLEPRLRAAHLPVWYVLAKRGPGSATWKAVEAKAGKLDLSHIAEQFAQAVKENRIEAVAEGQPMKPWADWLTAYAKLVAEKGVPVPDELKGADPNTYRLLQACMMESRSTGWQKLEGATDGWALRWNSIAWLARHNFSPTDDFTPGKTYQLFVRVKGGTIKKEGEAFNCGVYTNGKTLASATVKTSELADGQFHVLPVGQPTQWKDGGLFYIATGRDGAMSEVYLDCLWLAETPAK